VEHIWVMEVSFGRTKSAKKLVKGVARFWSSARLKLPLTIRGLQIELREGNELPAWAARYALSCSVYRTTGILASPRKQRPCIWTSQSSGVLADWH
jgi:hypothetical protein